MMRSVLKCLVLGLGLAFAGCSKPAPEMPPFPPPAVSISLPLEREVTDYQNFTGRTAATRMIQVRARVTGYLDKVNFKDGDLVKEKDILCEIDPRVYQGGLRSGGRQCRAIRGPRQSFARRIRPPPGPVDEGNHQPGRI